MFILSGRDAVADSPTVVYSPTDVTLADCPFRLLRTLDGVLGRAERLAEVDDPMLRRAALLGDAHEARVRLAYEEQYGTYDGVIPRGVAAIEPEGDFRATIATAREQTIAALRGGADVVFQATFFDGRFYGRADFLVKDGDGGGERQASSTPRPRYAVVDTKLTAKVRGTALLQLAAYADQLLALDVPITDRVWLHHGNGVRSDHLLADLLEVYRGERRLVEGLIDAHVALGRPVSWQEWRDGDAEPAELALLPAGLGVRRRACGRCEACTPEVERTDDVRLVHGMKAVHRTRLFAAGVHTVAELGALRTPVPRIPPLVQDRLVRQAAAQAGQRARIAAVEAAGWTLGPGARVVTPDGEPLADVDPAASAALEPVVRFQVLQREGRHVLAALPAPDPGDVYFDFEGDPMWAPHGALEGGLEYLFGLVEEGEQERYVAFWAHDRAQEKAALVDFLAWLQRRRARFPGMHVYHYASYEKTALERLAERHGAGLEEVLTLVREGVLVDLYPVVRNAVVVSQPSYGLKSLEPLYMGAELRDAGGVTTGGDSVVAYAEAAAARGAGEPGAEEAFAAAMAEIADYNRYDCVSTRRLLLWLRSLAGAGAGVTSQPVSTAESSARGPAPVGTPGPAADLPASPATPGPTASPEIGLRPTGEQRLVGALLAAAGESPRSDDDQAFALLAAAVDYHRREQAPGWREHFERLAQPRDWWAETRDVLSVGDGPEAVEVVEPWSTAGRYRRRRLRLTGTLGPASSPDAGRDVFCLHPAGAAEGLRIGTGAAYAATNAVLAEVSVSPDGTRAVFEVIERAPAEFAEGVGVDATPVAVVPGAPVPTKNPHAAIVDVAAHAAGLSPRDLDALPAGAPTPSGTPALSDTAAVELLRRRTPRLAGGGALPPLGEDRAATIARATAALDRSYLAVQGPPGSGKTHVGARVIARLVQQLGWRVGVVAQSHAVVENLLDQVVAGGLDAAQVAKKPATTPDLSDPAVVPPPWTMLGPDAHATFLAQHASDGCVIGGTMWDFTNRSRIADGELDLLVVDEAGQFSLANTLAASTSARRLLLLGDPQQLPQVSQGHHDEPVDQSALAWVTGGEPVMPPTHGYFLDRSWRMHSALCAAVSDLAYAGRLRSEVDVTDVRHLDGLAPGVHRRPVAHRGNSSASTEEAAEVVRLVRDLIGRPWRPDGESAPRPTESRDVLVVAAYNAQVALVRAMLDDAGLPGVRVGTVDKFQGQEAAVAIVTLAASSAREIPRGVGFLLDRHRLNVAVSRGQWAAVLVASPALADGVPLDGDALADLGAYLRLCARAPVLDLREPQPLGA
ncbi:bifunctional RecB family nuclease/DEAD/DEAH box helicase [Miniimonas sp. S16]|uniref:TM0106 family RecB-like putative nuclease n=1 Tax=Miniimonas sp. S16 TaxID=2171623 RepID=UPI000D52657E|nr:bifunctional RecB family nuclease/DEAD/DEAH box helicase [Miniimonas sp. S16]